MRRTKKSLFLFGLFSLVFLLVLATLQPLWVQVLGVDPEDQNLFSRYLPPFSRALPSRVQMENELDAGGAELEPLRDWLNARSISEISEEAKSLQTSEPELFRIITESRKFHVLGTDDLGRDVLVRLLVASKVSLTVAFLVALFSSLVGLIIGLFAGYFGGRVDNVLMRFTDSVLTLPLVALFIVMAKIEIPILQSLSPEVANLTRLILILCLFSWMPAARLVRGQVLAVKNLDFVQAAKSMGASHIQILSRHILPNTLPPLLVSGALSVGQSILMEAALSFLGLGIQPPTPSWGNMLNNAQELIQVAPHLAILPGVLILWTVLSFHFVSDGLQDAIGSK